MYCSPLIRGSICVFLGFHFLSYSVNSLLNLSGFLLDATPEIQFSVLISRISYLHIFEMKLIPAK
jgi:hypothetical protein